jgi:hypothetical protein
VSRRRGTASVSRRGCSCAASWMRWLLCSLAWTVSGQLGAVERHLPAGPIWLKLVFQPSLALTTNGRGVGGEDIAWRRGPGAFVGYSRRVPWC